MIGKQVRIQEPEPIESEDGATAYRYVQKCGVAFVKALDDEIVRVAYEKYKELGYTDLVLLDENEFGHFLREMLPLWKERHGE